MKKRIINPVILPAVSILIFFLIFSSCKKDSTGTEDSNDPALIGTWKLYEYIFDYDDGRYYEYDADNEGLEETITFNENKTYTSETIRTTWGSSGSGSWSIINGNEIKFSYSGGHYTIGRYSISGDRLTLIYDWSDMTETGKYDKQ